MNRYTFIGMILGVAATIGISLIVSAISDSSQTATGDGPEVVVQRWLDAARTADVDGMIELTRNPHVRKEINDQRYMIQRLVQEDPTRANARVGAGNQGGNAGETGSAPPLGTGFDFRYQMLPERHVIEGDNAAIVVRLTRRGNDVLRQFQLSRRDGTWKVDGYRAPPMRVGGDDDSTGDADNPADSPADNAAGTRENAPANTAENAPTNRPGTTPGNASRPASNE